jgi:hypothetical protein
VVCQQEGWACAVGEPAPSQNCGCFNKAGNCFVDNNPPSTVAPFCVEPPD